MSFIRDLTKLLNQPREKGRYRLKSINKTAVVNWPFFNYIELVCRTEEQQTAEPPCPNMRQSDIIGGGNNYADSCFFFSHEKVVSTHKILFCELKSTETHHPTTMKTYISLIVTDWPK